MQTNKDNLKKIMKEIVSYKNSPLAIQDYILVYNLRENWKPNRGLAIDIII